MYFLLILAILASALLTALAFRQAYLMTRFIEEGEPPPPPEEASFLQKLKLIAMGTRFIRKSNLTTPAEVGFTCRTLYLRSRPGVRLEIWWIPRPNPVGTVILFPGYNDPKSVLLPEAAEFHRLGYETILVDFPGAGGSSGTRTTIGWHEAKDVAAVVHAVKRHRPSEGPLVLFGKSMGAVAIIRAATRHGMKADSLILECPFASMHTVLANRCRIVGMPSFPLAPMVVWATHLVGGFPANRHRPVEEASRVSIPTLYIFGTQDRRVTREESLSIFRQLAGEKDLEEFPQSGHTRFLEDDPERWRRAVERFLLRLHERRRS